MKKLFSLIIVFNLLFAPFSFGFSDKFISKKEIVKDVYLTQYHGERSSEKYFALTDKDNRLIFDYQNKYKNIKPFFKNNKKDKDNLLMLATEKVIGSVATVVVIPNSKTDDVIKNIYDLNNENSFLKFYNYPAKNAIFPYKSKNGKFGYVIAKDNTFKIYRPVYKRIYFADNSSIHFRQFGLSYDNYVRFPDNNMPVLSQYYCDEDIEIKKDEIIFNFKSHNNNFAIREIALRDKNGKTTLEKIKKDYSPGSLDELYNYFISPKFINYPDTAMKVIEKRGKKGLVFYKNRKLKEIPIQYDDFRFCDMNSVIYQIFKVSYSSQDRILAKKGGLWGVIDSNNNVIVDFKYTNAHILFNKKNEELKSQKGYKLYYNVVPHPKNNLILAQMNDKFGVINYDGNVIMEFKNRQLKSNREDEFNVSKINKSRYFILKREEIANSANETYDTSVLSATAIIMLMLYFLTFSYF